MGQENPFIEQKFSNKDYVLVVTVVDSAFAKSALKTAQANGAEKCVVIHGRGKYLGKNQSVFTQPLDASRDLVLAVVHEDKAAAVTDNIFEMVGLKTEGHGWVYQLPMTSLAGIVDGQAGEIVESDGPPGRYEGGHE